MEQLNQSCESCILPLHFPLHLHLAMQSLLFALPFLSLFRVLNAVKCVSNANYPADNEFIEFDFTSNTTSCFGYLAVCRNLTNGCTQDDVIQNNTKLIAGGVASCSALKKVVSATPDDFRNVTCCDKDFCNRDFVNNFTSTINATRQNKKPNTASYTVPPILMSVVMGAMFSML